MRILLCLIILAICIISCRTSDEQAETFGINPDSVSFVPPRGKQEFELSFIDAGLGSNFGSKRPKFIAKGMDYTYTLSQNSFWKGQEVEKPEFICEGKLRRSSVDSIIMLINEIQDSSIYKVDPGISSGVYQTLNISYGDREIEFGLHNAYDVTVAKILSILNSNIPPGKRKLYIFGEDEPMKSQSEQL